MLKVASGTVDLRKQTHRLLAIAAEQAASGRGLIGCGTAYKALEIARLKRDYQSIMLASGFIADVLGYSIAGNCLSYWREAAHYFISGEWAGKEIRRHWQEELLACATLAEDELLKQHSRQLAAAATNSAKPELVGSGSR